MSELTIWINGKLVKVDWGSPNPPGEQDINDIVAAYKARPPTPASPATGRIGPSMSRIEGTLPGAQLQPGNPNTPYSPFGQGAGVQTEGTKKPVTKKEVAKTAPKSQPSLNQVVQDLQSSLGGGFQRDQGLANQPQPAQKLTRGAEVADLVKKFEKRPVQKAKAALHLAKGEMNLPGIGRIPWTQSGVGFEAEFPMIGRVKGGSPQDLARNARRAYEVLREQKKTEATSPNVAAYEPSRDMALPPNVQRPANPYRVIEMMPPKEKYAAQMKIISDVGEFFGDQLSKITPQHLFIQGAEHFGMKVPEFVKTIADAPSKVAGSVGADVLMTPYRWQAKAEVLNSPAYSAQEKLETAAGLFLEVATAGVAPGGQSALDAGIAWAGKKFGSAERFAKALEGLPIEARQKAAIKDYLKKNPNLVLKGIEDGKPKVAVKAGARKIEEVAPQVKPSASDVDARIKAKQDEIDSLYKSKASIGKIAKVQDELDDLVKERLNAPQVEPPAAPKSNVRGNVSQETLESKPGKPETGAEVKPQVKSTKPKTPAETNLNKAQPPGGSTGLARRFENPERAAAGKEKVPAQPQAAEDLAAKGRRLIEKEGHDPKEIIRKTLDEGHRPSPLEDVPVVQYYKAQVKAEKAKLLAGEQTPETQLRLALLDKETDQIDQFAQKARSEFHGMGEALQISHGDDMEFVSLRDQARAANLGKDLAPRVEAELKDISEKYAAALKENESLKAQIAKDFKGSPVRGGDTKKMRGDALGRLRKLGINTVDAPVPGKIKGKQAGAVRIPQGGRVNPQVARAVRDVANSYIRDGVTDFDEILKRLGKDIPGMTEDELLSALSPGFRQRRTEATIAANKARRIMNDVRARAEFRTKDILGKALDVTTDLTKNVKRTLQASFDLSAAMLQGKPALLARPGSWLKSWDAAAKALVAKPLATEEVQQRLWAELLQDPVIREAHEQGWLNLRSPHGAFSPQEEIFRGNIASKVPGVARSDSMFSSQLNAMYGDWYRKLASIDPENDHYKQSVAAIINIFSGRGHGKFADFLSNPAFSWFGYAPRYAYSLAQVGTGAPIWMKGLSGRARIEAAKAYLGGMTSIYIVNQIAPLFGWKVDNDLRSVDYGTLTGPDGRQVDAYNKITQFPRMLWQMFYGKIGKRGNYKEPGDWGFEPLQDYIHANFSPFLRDMELLATGKVWDAQAKEMRPATKMDLALSFAPLALQDLTKMEDKDAANVVLGFTGGRPSKASPKVIKAGEKEPPALEPVPPGLHRILNPVDIFGRPMDESAQKRDAKYIAEMKRLGLSVPPLSAEGSETYAQTGKRSREMSDMVFELVKALIDSPGYASLPKSVKKEALEKTIAQGKKQATSRVNDVKKQARTMSNQNKVEEEMKAGIK